MWDNCQSTYCSRRLPKSNAQCQLSKDVAASLVSQSGMKNGGANCRICAEKLFCQSFKKAAFSVPFLIMGALLEKRRRKVTGKKSKKVNPLDFIVVKVKNTSFGPKRSKRERDRVVSPGVGRVLEHETNPLRFSRRFLKFVATVLKKIKVCIWFSYTLTAALFFLGGGRQITVHKPTGSLRVLSSDFFLFFCKFVRVKYWRIM